MNIEILGERVSAGGYSLIVRDQGGVIEPLQINAFHHRICHAC